MEFTQIEKAKAYVAEEEAGRSAWLASRCALRAMAYLSRPQDNDFEALALPAFRAILTAAGRAACFIDDASAWEEAGRMANLGVADTLPANFFGAAEYAGAAARDAALAATSATNRASAVEFAYRSNFFSVSGVSEDFLRAISNDAARSEEAGVPLWASMDVPKDLEFARRGLLKFFREDREAWEWWEDWYNAMYRGDAVDWHFALKVAQIDDSIWQRSALAVAREIARLEGDATAVDLDTEALAAHLRTLASSNTSLHSDAARGCADLIQTAIDKFIAETGANRLPEGFQSFDALPKAFLGIAAALGESSASETAALEARVQKLNADINQLRADLAQAKQDLLEARLTGVEAAQMRTFGEKLTTTLTAVTLVGTIGLNLLTFFGLQEDEVKYDELKRQLEDMTEEMQKARPAESDEAPRPPIEI